jgi:hypothetical protein
LSERGGEIMRVLLLLVVLLILSTSAFSRTWYILPDGTGDAPTIQAGVDSSGVGDTVLVAAGIYYEQVRVETHGDIYILSEIGASETIIDAQALGRAFTADVGGDWLVLDGFSLTNGDATFENIPLGGGLFFLDVNYTGTSRVSNLIVRDCRAQEGGGILFRSEGGMLQKCLVENNEALGASGGIRAGGGEQFSCYVESCTVVGNSAPSEAGVSLFRTGLGGVPIFRNNIVVGNGSGVGVYCEGLSPGDIRCNDVWNNLDGNYGGDCGDPTGEYGNISIDPLFCDLENGDYTLTSTSPCVPGNHPDGYDCGLIGFYGTGCVPTAVNPHERTTWGMIKSIYR